MSSLAAPAPSLDAELDPEVCERALRARDARFDGLFFVGITTTGIYCRPVCPARVTYPERRRFFNSAASAERAGFRPCMRCRPELAPGRALCDAVSRLAGAAALRIAAGALNGRNVAALARDLFVSERHLRRALERELGVSPIELAQTHRLLLAKRLLADTELPVTRIAFASGFQSLRRFNAAFSEQYRLSPSAVRHSRRALRSTESDAALDLVRLTLAYRPPLAWDILLDCLRCDAIPGFEVIDGNRFGRTVQLDGQRGVIFVEDAAFARNRVTGRRTNGVVERNTHINVDVSTSLVPVLMPLLARLRQLLDLDSEPVVVDAQLEQSGLGALVRTRAGLRIPGALNGFEVALRTILTGRASPGARAGPLAQRVLHALSEPFYTGVATLDRLMPDAERVADIGVDGLTQLGASRRRAQAISAVAALVATNKLRLEPGVDAATTHAALLDAGVSDRIASVIVMRALRWPDAFPATDRTLQRVARVTTSRALLASADVWRPWRAYAALHLWLHGEAET